MGVLNCKFFIYLGVHDAQQTAGEMMEALQRLRMENIQLQSRLSHLSRGIVFIINDKMVFVQNHSIFHSNTVQSSFWEVITNIGRRIV